MRLSVILCILFSFLTASVCLGATWNLAALSDNTETEGDFKDITFTFENNTLALNTEAIATWPGSSCEVWQVIFSGNWAVCGTVDGSGNLISDTYATFDINGNGGHINWAQNTPSGYVAPLLIGYSFTGDGSVTYTNRIYDNVIDTTNGTVVLRNYLAMRLDEQDFYTHLDHAFYATYPTVPEPGSIITLMSGLIGLVGVISRNKARMIRHRQD